jgi:hypothetical protein
LRRNVPGATCVLVNNKEVFVRLLAAVLMLACLALLAVPAQAAEATRTLDQSLPVSPGAAFAVLNLAGTLTVVPAPGPAVRVKATVHAESDDLAASVSLATVTGKDGTPTLRVEYPVDRHDEFRYPPRGGGSDSGFDYAGRRVRVSGSRGVLLYADLVVEVPAGAGKGRLETHAGAIQADHMDGSLRFETGSGSIQISHSKGDIVGDTGSGDVVALDVHGSFRCETGSGDCRVEGFEGDQLGCDTGSGAILVSRATARTLSLDTGSGRVRLGAIEAEEVKVDTGSGSVEIEVVGDRLRRLVADTGSGAVRLRLPAQAGFEAKANLGSGDLRCDYSDAEKIVKRSEVVGCRRGDRRIEIKVDTGSGGLVIEPAR